MFCSILWQLQWVGDLILIKPHLQFSTTGELYVLQLIYRPDPLLWLIYVTIKTATSFLW